MQPLPSHRAVHLVFISLIDWGGDVRSRVVAALRSIVRSSQDARVVVIGTQADMVGTPLDHSGSTLSVDERMEELIGMVQVGVCVRVWLCVYRGGWEGSSVHSTPPQRLVYGCFLLHPRFLCLWP